MKAIQDFDTRSVCLWSEDPDMTICGNPFEDYADLTDMNFVVGSNEVPAIKVSQITCEDCLILIREIKNLK
jgi:hypothetical protein